MAGKLVAGGGMAAATAAGNATTLNSEGFERVDGKKRSGKVEEADGDATDTSA
jgi:hypothetical protein